LRIVSFSAENKPRLGLISSDGAEFKDLTSADGRTFSSLNSAIIAATTEGLSVEELIRRKTKSTRLPSLRASEAKLLIPLVPDEVWCGGVTYAKSRDAREREQRSKGIYEYVLTAKRPELFFKATASRCMGPEDYIAVRSDSRWTVPEPELGVVLSGTGEVVGYTVADDVSARDIEGESPLYLPQAKIYDNSCSIGPCVTTPESIRNPANLSVAMKIIRKGHVAFEDSTSTARMVRSVEHLVSYLQRDYSLPPSIVLMTGTGIVPPDKFSLKGGDVVEIEIEGIGRLRNTVKQLRPRRRISGKRVGNAAALGCGYQRQYPM
jgi:2-dehydro-3-deoxy-D-arabinonate dehydratase